MDKQMDTNNTRTAYLESSLYGSNPLERVVAAEIADNQLRLWVRTPDDQLQIENIPFRRWVLTNTPKEFENSETLELEGDGLRWLHTFPDHHAYRDAISHWKNDRRENLYYGSEIRMALIDTGVTLFKGMAFDEVHRMQVDIETEGLSADTEKILLIAVKDNRGYVNALMGDEKEILSQFIALVRELDPDILEGHNIYGFDLPFIIRRAEIIGMPLSLGRDGSAPRNLGARQYAIGGNSRPFQEIFIHGRHVVDTYLAVQRYDLAKGSLTSYGLKNVAKAFGIAEPDRIILPRDEMKRLFEQDRAKVVEYATQDVVETERLAELVTPTDFYQTQMVPDSYGSVAVSGTGEKINSIFVRAYLAQNQAIPTPSPVKDIPGGYTELRRAGVLDHIVKADVESLYPSIMISDRIAPAKDRLNLFLPILEELTHRRLDAKSRMRSAQGKERYLWDGIQGSFKVLINSFYGYLGAANFHFNDPDAAARVTARGRELVQQIAEWIEDEGGNVIEIDTDGVYFVAPSSLETETDEVEFIERIGAKLPSGIRLAFDGRYRTMISLKTKNYVLMEYDGDIVFKGSSLRSRADEPYGKSFIETAVKLLFEHRENDIADLYIRTIQALKDHRIPVEDLARRERITDKTFNSTNRKRLAEVAGDARQGDFVHVYERMNGKLGLMEDYEKNGRDENTKTYIDKLYKFASRLRDAFPDRFDVIIPKPSTITFHGEQESLDLD